MCVCFRPLLKTTEIVLNIFRMAFRNETLACGLFCLSIQTFRIFKAMLPMFDSSLSKRKPPPPFKTSAHFCSNYTFPNTKITKCNCFAQTRVLPQCILCLCWLPVFACLYADFCFNSKFALILYLLFSFFSFPAK